MSTQLTARQRITHDVLDRVGGTPLCRLSGVESRKNDIEILFKAEWINPSGSVKDRAASQIIVNAIASGKLTRDRWILDATSGNNGVSLAMIGAALGYRVRLCVPANICEEKKRVLRAYGADLVFTSVAEGSDGAIRQAKAIASERENRYFYADQYSNPSNWQAHYYGTAEEIWEQTGGSVTHFVAAVGSSGTFVGTSRRLKELNPAIKCISLQPDSARHGLKGMKHMASALVPAIYDPTVADKNLEINTEEAHDMIRLLAREEGLLLGVTSGAALIGCRKVARWLSGPATIVTIFADSADKYLSEPYWSV